MEGCAKLGLCAFYLIIFTISASAQDLQTKYPFLNLGKNKVDFYGDSTVFDSFFEKLDNILLEGDGQLNILHMGGSHVQGGVLSHTMRKNMQSIAPGLQGGRGLLFPFELAKTNNPWNYVVKKTGEWEGSRVSLTDHFSEWGVSGITATAYDANSTATVYARSEEDDFAFDRVRIFYHQCECSFEPVVTSPHIFETRIDSTASFIEFDFSSPQDTLYLSLKQTDSTQSQFILQGIQFLSEGPSVIYNPIGVNGASTDDYLRSQSLPQQIKQIAPDLVIFGIGINDANTYAKLFDQEQFEANYRELVRIIRVANPNCDIIFMTNNDCYFMKKYPNPNAYKVRESMIGLATEMNGAVWDLFEIMGGFDSIRLWEEYELASSDKIHFTRAGYELQADLLFKALRKAYGDYLFASYSK